MQKPARKPLQDVCPWPSLQLQHQFSTGSEEEHRRLVFIKFKVVAENAHQEVHQQNGDTNTGDVEEDVGLNLPCVIQGQEAGLSAVLAPK